MDRDLRPASGYQPTMPTLPLPAELSEFLARPNPAVIGTVTASGDPRTVATWYVWEDGRVLMNLEDGRARLDDMRRDPRASPSPPRRPSSSRRPRRRRPSPPAA